MATARRSMFLGLGALVALGASSCASRPHPTETLVELRTEAYGTVLGLSTECGILALAEVVAEEDLEFRYHVGNGRFDDHAVRTATDEVLSLYRPVSSRPNLARFCAFPAEDEETLYLEVRREGRPTLLRARLLEGGSLGDLLTLDDSEPLESFAAEHTGCGVWVFRDGYLQLAGILNGMWTESPGALAFVGIDRIAHVLPQTVSYFQRQTLPYRADFEYGIPRDLEGERIHSSGVDPIPDYATSPVQPRRDGSSREIDVESLLEDGR